MADQPPNNAPAPPPAPLRRPSLLLNVVCAVLVLCVLAAAAWPQGVGNHTVAALSRLWLQGPTGFLGWLVLQWPVVLGVMFFFVLDAALMAYLHGRGRRFLAESGIVAGFFGPAHRRAYGQLAGVLVLVLNAVWRLVLLGPVITLALIDPDAFLKTCLAVGLLVGALRPNQWSRQAPWWLALVAGALVVSRMTADFSWDGQLGLLFLSGGVLLVCLKAAQLAREGAAEVRLRRWAVGGVATLFAYSSMSEEGLFLTLGLLTVGGLTLWRVLRPAPLTWATGYRWCLLVAVSLIVWQAVRTHPITPPLEKTAVSPPGEGVRWLFSDDRGSVAGLDNQGRTLWVRPADTSQIPLTTTLPRFFNTIGGAFVLDDVVAVLGGQALGTDKATRTVSYDALNEVILYGVRDGITMIRRERALDCELLAGITPFDEHQAFLLCARPHGVMRMNLRNAYITNLLPLRGTFLTRPDLLTIHGKVIVTEGPAGQSTWVYTPQPGDFSTVPPVAEIPLVALPTGPTGAVGAVPGSPVGIVATTPFGSLWRVDVSGKTPTARHLLPQPGANFWRPTAVGVLPWGYLVLENPYPGLARGLRHHGGGLFPSPRLDLPGEGSLRDVVITPDAVWLGSNRRVYRVPLSAP